MVAAQATDAELINQTEKNEREHRQPIPRLPRRPCRQIVVRCIGCLRFEVWLDEPEVQALRTSVFRAEPSAAADALKRRGQ